MILHFHRISILVYLGINFKTYNNNEIQHHCIAFICIYHVALKQTERAEKSKYNKIRVIQHTIWIRNCNVMFCVLCVLYSMWHTINIHFTFYLIHTCLHFIPYSSYEPLNNPNVWTVNTEDKCEYNGKLMEKIIHFGQTQIIVLVLSYFFGWENGKLFNLSSHFSWSDRPLAIE